MVKPCARSNRSGSRTLTNKATDATYTVECVDYDGKRFASAPALPPLGERR